MLRGLAQRSIISDVLLIGREGDAVRAGQVASEQVEPAVADPKDAAEGEVPSAGRPAPRAFGCSNQSAAAADSA
jgi:hypothetical protein